MRVVSKKALREFWESHPDSKGPLEAWYHETKSSEWDSPADVKERYAAASILKGGRVVFNIKGNTYRLVVRINYGSRIVYIRFVGTHKEYNGINAEEV